MSQKSVMSTYGRISNGVDVESTADSPSAARREDSTNARNERHSQSGLMSTADSSPKTPSPSVDLSAEVIVTNRDMHVFTALRYHIERMRDPSDSATEVMVLDPGTSTCRVVPLAMGWGIVRSPGEPDIRFDIFEDQISLMSAHKRIVYDFVYEALDDYSEIKNPRESILN